MFMHVNLEMKDNDKRMYFGSFEIEMMMDVHLHSLFVSVSPWSPTIKLHPHLYLKKYNIKLFFFSEDGAKETEEGAGCMDEEGAGCMDEEGAGAAAISQADKNPSTPVNIGSYALNFICV